VPEQVPEHVRNYIAEAVERMTAGTPVCGCDECQVESVDEFNTTWENEPIQSSQAEGYAVGLSNDLGAASVGDLLGDEDGPHLGERLDKVEQIIDEALAPSTPALESPWLIMDDLPDTEPPSFTYRERIREWFRAEVAARIRPGSVETLQFGPTRDDIYQAMLDAEHEPSEPFFVSLICESDQGGDQILVGYGELTARTREIEDGWMVYDAADITFPRVTGRIVGIRLFNFAGTYLQDQLEVPGLPRDMLDADLTIEWPSTGIMSVSAVIDDGPHNFPQAVLDELEYQAGPDGDGRVILAMTELNNEGME